MLVRQLEYFVAVAREQHFGRAAEACYVSQPALSTAIVKLERELNVTLINRGKHFEGLTPAGMRLVGRASQLLADHYRFKAVAAALHSGISGTMRLGTGPTVSSTVTATLVARFCHANPAANVRVSTVSASTDLVAQLRVAELEVGVAHFGHSAIAGLIVLPLYKEQYVLVAGSTLISGIRSMTWVDAAALPLALPRPATGSRQLIDATFASVGAVPYPRIETDSLAELYAHVATGECASVVPRSWLRVMSTTTAMRAVPLIRPDATEEISIAISADRGSGAGRTFLDTVAKQDSADVLDIDLTADFGRM